MISFQSFTPADFNKMVLDMKAAKHLRVTQKNIDPSNIAIVGASIECADLRGAVLTGANLYRTFRLES